MARKEAMGHREELDFYSGSLGEPQQSEEQGRNRVLQCAHREEQGKRAAWRQGRNFIKANFGGNFLSLFPFFFFL
jgi:hypothetical protein